MYNFEPYNVLLAIATNIAVLLKTASVLQAHRWITGDLVLVSVWRDSFVQLCLCLSRTEACKCVWLSLTCFIWRVSVALFGQQSIHIYSIFSHQRENSYWSNELFLGRFFIDTIVQTHIRFCVICAAWGKETHLVCFSWVHTTDLKGQFQVVISALVDVTADT